MTYPLKNWNKLPYGFKFGQKYPRGWGNLSGQPHIGTDKICPTGTPIYAHLAGTAKKVRTLVQGNAVHIIDVNGHLVRYMHMSKVAKVGVVKKGDIIGYVGSTGTSTAPHLHVDVSKGKVYIPKFTNFINPEDYFIQKPAPKPVKRTYIVKRGDSLWLIALKNRMSLKRLRAKNPQIKNPNEIKIGQKINL